MKIRDIITEAEEKDLEKSLDSYFKKKEIEKKRAELRAKPKAASAQAAEPEGDNAFSRTLSKVNAPKDKTDRAEFVKGVKRGWHSGEELKQAASNVYNKVTSHKLFQPK